MIIGIWKGCTPTKNSGVLNKPCKAKCAHGMNSCRGYSEFCELIHTQGSNTPAADLLKTFLNTQLVLSVAPTNVNSQEMFFSENGEFALNVGLSFKSAPTRRHWQRRLKQNQLSHVPFLLFCGHIMLLRKVGWISEEYLFWHYEAGACNIFLIHLYLWTLYAALSRKVNLLYMTYVTVQKQDKIE